MLRWVEGVGSCHYSCASIRFSVRFSCSGRSARARGMTEAQRARPLFAITIGMMLTTALLTGVAALSLGQGPYSSLGQEIWYRFGSIGFVVAGAGIPAAALWLGARRSIYAMLALLLWMVLVLCGWLFYLMMSGGGV